MKKITLLSLVAATVLFTGCGEDAKKAAADAASAVTDTVKEHATAAMDSAKSAAADAVEATKAKAVEAASEVREAASAKVADATQALKEKAAEATEKVTGVVKQTAERVIDPSKEVGAADATPAETTQSATTTDSASGKVAFAKCAGCHGADGKTKALGKSEIIAGQSVADLETKLAAYKAGTRNVAGMGMLMKGQVSAMSDEDIKAVAEYISSL